MKGRIEVTCPGCHQTRLVHMSDWKKRKSDDCVSCSNRRRAGLETTGANSGKGTRLYNIWRGMRQRCGHFGGGHKRDLECYMERGIKVCHKWRKSFANFKEWAHHNGYSKELVIDRRDNDKGYNPGNCRWITVVESNRNKRNTLSREQRASILSACANGSTQRSQAQLHSIPDATVSLLINGKTFA